MAREEAALRRVLPWLSSAEMEGHGAMNTPSSTPLLEVRDLHKTFGARGRSKHGPVVAVGGVSFTLEAGECLAIVGESGSGKSTLARTLLRLVRPDSGAVLYRGEDLVGLSGEKMRQQR